MSKTVDTAVRPLYAVAGATDLAVELARGYVAEAQDRATATQKLAQTNLEPRALQARVSDLAKQRQARVEKRVNDLQDQAKAIPGKVESYAKDTVSDFTETYAELVSRGEDVVKRIRKQQATQDAVAAVKNTESRAKATVTTAKKSAAATRSSAKATATTAEKDVSEDAAATRTAAKRTATTAKKGAKATKSSAKATGTSARKAAEKTAKAVTDAADKIG